MHAFLERLLYKKKTKWILLAVQAICAGVLVLCLLTIGFWMEDSDSLREMSKNFEESDLFFRQVDTILRNKIDGQDNDALFEEDGEYSGNKGDRYSVLWEEQQLRAGYEYDVPCL